MPNMNVTYGDMHSAATRLSSGKADIESKLRELKNEVDNLVANSYVTDRSSKAFDDAYQEFNTGVTQTIEGLEGMSQYLNQAAQTLQETDEQLAGSISGQG